MSADNVLISLEHEGRILIYDVNFSDISSHRSWRFPLTPANAEALKQHIRANEHYWLVGTGGNWQWACRFCDRYARSNVVEYGHSTLLSKTQQRLINTVFTVEHIGGKVHGVYADMGVAQGRVDAKNEEYHAAHPDSGGATPFSLGEYCVE